MFYACCTFLFSVFTVFWSYVCKLHFLHVLFLLTVFLLFGKTQSDWAWELFILLWLYFLRKRFFSQLQKICQRVETETTSSSCWENNQVIHYFFSLLAYFVLAKLALNYDWKCIIPMCGWLSGLENEVTVWASVAIFHHWAWLWLDTIYYCDINTKTSYCLECSLLSRWY